ncbi:unnamed protein product [Ambrosiozyma monospora]|uniref:Unnamed protein product n=1 Tax=Ambrosiozyma monospora TaxID=43982 RepID=A0A9W7DER1_AMBMO|nr:unnamed protein product [Ambrosiozyma monospora]
MKIRDAEYLLCISCSLKLRRLIDLLNFLKNLKPTFKEEEVIKNWLKLIELRAKLFYTKLGCWDDSDENGLVYGWKNIWIAQELINDKKASKLDEIDDETSLNSVAVTTTTTTKTATEDSEIASPKELGSVDSLPAAQKLTVKSSNTTEDTNSDIDEFNDAKEHA